MTHDHELPPKFSGAEPAPAPAPKPVPAPVAAPAPARAKLSPGGADVRAAVLNQMISAELKTKFAALDADDASWLIAALVSSACEEKIGRIAGDMQQRVSLSLSGTDSASLKMLFADVVDERVGSAVNAAVKSSISLSFDRAFDRHFSTLVDSQNDRFASLSKSISKISGAGAVASDGADPAGLEKAIERALEKRAGSEMTTLAMLAAASALAGLGVGALFF